jgi:hypothetical protein
MTKCFETQSRYVDENFCAQYDHRESYKSVNKKNEGNLISTKTTIYSTLTDVFLFYMFYSRKYNGCVVALIGKTNSDCVHKTISSSIV